MSDKDLESELRALVKLVSRKGLAIRREKLARGHAFRVKSGDCRLRSERVLFVDKTLPLKQQHIMVAEYLRDSGIQLSEAELEQFKILRKYHSEEAVLHG